MIQQWLLSTECSTVNVSVIVNVNQSLREQVGGILVSVYPNDSATASPESLRRVMILVGHLVIEHAKAKY